MWVMVCSCFSSARSKLVAISLLFCSTFGSRVLILSTITLGGMIASDPNAKEKGVSPIACLLVVRYAYRHSRRSSGHFPFLSVWDFLRQLRIVLLDASAYPFP
ncbi:hypothetical protein ACFX13_027827 [Malus domestica]